MRFRSPHLSLLLGTLPAVSHSAGYYLPNQDAFATAKGNAFIATADSAAAVFYNPAGLTQLERSEAQVGLYSIQLGHEITTPAGGKYRNKAEWQAAPQIFYAEPLSDGWAWGLGLNSPWGLGNDWGNDTPFRTVITEARLAYLSATVALGYQVSDTLSIGASVSGNYADLTLEQGLGFMPGDYLRYEGDGVAVSGAISARWQPHEKHAFGLIFSSPSTFDLEGRATSNVLSNGSAEMEFMTPMRIAFGYSFRPAPGWNIEANIEWLDWDSLDTLELDSAPAPLGTVDVPFHWKSNFIYEIGASYTTESGYRFAVGYDYNSGVQTDPSYNPGVGDADHHWLNAGFGRLSEEGLSWFLTYQFGYSDHSVTGSVPNLAGQTANGKYRARHHAVMVSCNYRF